MPAIIISRSTTEAAARIRAAVHVLDQGINQVLITKRNAKHSSKTPDFIGSIPIVSFIFLIMSALIILLLISSTVDYIRAWGERGGAQHLSSTKGWVSPGKLQYMLMKHYGAPEVLLQHTDNFEMVR